MHHNLKAEGFSLRLRPVVEQDAAFILKMRTDPQLSGFIGSTSPRLEDQINWMHNYEQRPGDYYFIAEDLASQKPLGTIAIYDINDQISHAEWGRWIMSPGSLAAVECVLLLYTIAFETLGLKRLYCRSVAANSKVVSFHTSCGLTTVAPLPNYVTIDGKKYDSVEQELLASNWPSVKSRLTVLTERLNHSLQTKK